MNRLVERELSVDYNLDWKEQPRSLPRFPWQCTNLGGNSQLVGDGGVRQSSIFLELNLGDF